MQICRQFSPVHLEKLFNFQKLCMTEEKEKYEENLELNNEEIYFEKRLI